MLAAYTCSHVMLLRASSVSLLAGLAFLPSKPGVQGRLEPQIGHRAAAAEATCDAALPAIQPLLPTGCNPE